MTMTETTTPQVWIGCLACYNAGRLVGRWVDADEAGDVTSETLHEVAANLAGTDPNEPADLGAHDELWVFDHQGFGGVLGGVLDAECSPAEAQRWAELIEACDEKPEALAAWLDHIGRAYVPEDVDQAAEHFREAYQGEWDSLADYAEELAQYTARERETRELMTEGRWPFSCIDWECAGRELEVGGDVFTVEAPGGGVYVFDALA